jgi:hypothetical protein
MKRMRLGIARVIARILHRTPQNGKFRSEPGTLQEKWTLS